MNYFLKCPTFFFLTVLISFCLFPQCFFTLANESVLLPIYEKTNAPNGPVDLPGDIKLKLGLRKYKYHSKDNETDDLIKEELREDVEKLKDAITKTDFPFEEPNNTFREYELNYDLPPWLIEMIALSDSSKNTLEHLGVEGLPDTKACEKIKNLKEQMLCIVDALEEIKDVYENAKDITTLTARVLAGGRMAIKALARLKTLSSASYNKQLMKSLGTPMATLILLQRETTSDRNRWLAGSVLTLLTDIPVITDLADVKTGSYGHVNVIMPRQSRVRRADRNILRIREGTAPSELINGYTTTEALYSI